MSLKRIVPRNINGRFLAKVAILYYIEGMTQADIADKLNISRSQISRYLDEARKRNIVRISVHAPENEYLDLENMLEKMFRIKECFIVSGREKEKYNFMANSFKELMQRIMQQNDYIGIGWGKTVYNILNQLHFDNLYRVNVVPMVGGIGITETEVNTNTMAKIFAERVGGKNYIIHCPAIFSDKKTRDAVSEDQNYKEIQECQNKINIAVLGMGELSSSSTFVKSLNLQQDEIKRLREMGIIGEINGNFLNSKGEFVPNPISDRILTASVEEIRKSNTVIGLSFGLKKEKIINACLKSGLIDILITDEETAGNLIKSKNLL